MMLKNIVKKFSLVLFVVFSVAFTFLIFISAGVKTELLKHNLIDERLIADTIVVHFIHGSIPKENCDYKKRRLGGYLGGHIEIEVNDRVFGFLHDSIPVNIIPKKSYNSKFENRKDSAWVDFVKDDKITSIFIPVSRTQNDSLFNRLNSYFVKTPYDYSFFGHRCTSSTAKVLSDFNILNEFSDFEAIVAFFYPRMLRHILVDYAELHELRIVKKRGSECHKWE